jgi:imidazolonepropionase-like amidohydrolase
MKQVREVIGVSFKAAAIALSFLLAAHAAADTVAVTGALVVDVRSGTVQPLDILIRDDRITQLRPRGALGKEQGVRAVDASGLYAIPGLWDAHIHVTNEPLLQEVIGALLIANGVTSVRDMGGAIERLRAFRERSRGADAVAPRMWFSGPIIDGMPAVRMNQNFAVDTPQEALKSLDSLIENGVDFIKVYEMLRPEVFTAIVERAHARGLKVTGHVPIRMTTPGVLEAGLDGIEHLRGLELDCAEDPQRLLTERVAIMDAHTSPTGGMELRRKVHEAVRPQALAHQSRARCTALIQSFVKHGTWHTPTLNIVSFRALRLYDDPHWRDRLRYVPAALQERWRKTLVEYTDETKYEEWRAHGEWALQLVGEMHRTGVRLLVGTDAPALPTTPGFSLHDELQAMVRAGMPPLAVLQAATINPAEFFGATVEMGTIEQGKLADIVLLEANPLADIASSRRIRTVISKGRVYDRAALDAMLNAIETNGE